MASKVGEFGVSGVQTTTYAPQEGAPRTSAASYPSSIPSPVSSPRDLGQSSSFTGVATPKSLLADGSLVLKCSYLTGSVAMSSVFKFPNIPEVSDRPVEVMEQIVQLKERYAEFFGESKDLYESLFPTPGAVSRERESSLPQIVSKGPQKPVKVENLDYKFQSIATDFRCALTEVKELALKLEPEAAMPTTHKATREALIRSINEVSLLSIKSKILLEHLRIAEELVPALRILQDKLANTMHKAVLEELMGREAAGAVWDDATSKRFCDSVEDKKAAFQTFQMQVTDFQTNVLQPAYAELIPAIKGYPYNEYLSSFVIDEMYGYATKATVTTPLRHEIDSANRLRAQSRDQLKASWGVLYAELVDYATELNRLILATSDGKLPPKATAGGIGKAFANVFRSRSVIERQVVVTVSEQMNVISEGSSSSQTTDNSLTNSTSSPYSTNAGNG